MTQLDEDVMTKVKFDDYAHQTLQANHLFGNLVNHISGYIQGSNDLDYSEHFTLQSHIIICGGECVNAQRLSC